MLFEEQIRKQNIYLLMFGYVQSARRLMPTVSVVHVLGMFMDDFRLNHSEYNIESLRTQYFRMQKEQIKGGKA